MTDESFDLATWLLKGFELFAELDACPLPLSIDVWIEPSRTVRARIRLAVFANKAFLDNLYPPASD